MIKAEQRCRLPIPIVRALAIAGLLLAGLTSEPAFFEGVALGAVRQPEPAAVAPGEGRSSGQLEAGTAEHVAATREGQQEAADAEHEPGIWSLIARLVNFGILVGVLVYFLRSPLGRYLTNRSKQVREDLADAAEMRDAASAQLEEIDRRLKALPAEIEALKTRSAQEIAAEEARIAQAAEGDRERLVAQTRREIELQLRVAKRDLMKQAAELAVGAASVRIKRQITTEDQVRLVDGYLEQVKTDHE